ncbi:MAG: dihydroorotate dehydrogenase electron transfer subunit [Gammaproteobacteria bacterium]|nr:dihydroorotate dehydrogenase electron transfer subunit [Gammaproteobacteria bacterium]NIR28338.1 dihydroorotate dehydrogenase electron transfer subunit [Gammaproteobacteria bacterium]NIR96752.1 dihydroorotate dehydrogenase electron transfer subunit [Gammaproteobacteria bacterium]NIT62454.1 dihydroorotate dehydrogenase electron transfer subunit [Gammaproteobacteria bacterium]NIV19387.1 dihydroorotate dehydrogenase electron transfer subunit [Gammaproteobacteria bacterium]
MTRAPRDTIFVEQAEVLTHQGLPGEQYALRLQAPRCAARAQPGSFVHLTCDPSLPMRRPLSIMRASVEHGWIELLYKMVGRGTALLARRRPGELLSVLGPIGRPFEPHMERPRALLVGGGVGIPPMVFLAERLLAVRGAYEPLVLMGSEVPFPFRARPSQILVPGLPEGVIATMPLLDDWGVACRLASQQGFPGCHEGYVTDLVRLWLDRLEEGARREVEIFACGPHPMLEAIARLARERGLPCQVSLEEFMACGVGGCAGCAVEVQTAGGPAMRRVCVDGPVFDAYSVAQFTVDSEQ